MVLGKRVGVSDLRISALPTTAPFQRSVDRGSIQRSMVVEAFTAGRLAQGLQCGAHAMS